jgi:hypothetical protein
MTIQERPSAEATAATLRRALDSREAGDWQPVARWLATRLNEIDDDIDGVLDALARAARLDEIDRHVDLVGADRRDIDLIVLGDGTRVCWHLGKARSTTGWVVELCVTDCR